MRESIPKILAEGPSRIGKFIQTYHSFLSSFVIGAAGLVATSIWQYRQSETAARQAESQQRIAATQADNNWRIERAEILSKNLAVLASSSEDTVEQRYGVLLSLSRGNIIDPELAVSYALELGKNNATYMKSVLASTTTKSYERLLAAYELTCQQRFGVVRDAPVCLSDAHVERSHALAELFAEESDAARRVGTLGPPQLLIDEREVQTAPLRLTALFGYYLNDLFERRQWPDIERFEHISNGARLISALVLGPTPPNAFVAASEADEIKHFHEQRTKWVSEYLFTPSCNGECRGKLVDIMLTSYAESEGRYDEALRQLFVRPRSEVAMPLARLHNRLLLCQADPSDANAFRDNVLVPALNEVENRKAPPGDTLLEDVLGLLALTPDPDFAPDEASKARRAAWEAALARARTATPVLYDTAFTVRRVSVQDTRKNPPAKYKAGMLCTADEVSLADVAISE